MSKDIFATFALGAATAFLATACDKGGQDASAPQGAAAADAKVKCVGINECKGQGQCDMPTHVCAWQNWCKGKGWIMVKASECEAKGGKPKA